MSKIVRSLYRSILRLATRFDAHSLSKLLLYRNNLNVPSKLSNMIASRYYHNILVRRLYKNQDEAKLISPRHYNNVSLRRIVQEEFRRGNVIMDEHTPYPSSSFSDTQSEAQQAHVLKGGDGKEGVVEITDRIDAAFTVLRKLSVIWKSFDSMYFVQQEALNTTDDTATPANDDPTKNKHDSNIGKGTDLNVTESLALLPGILLAAHPMVKGPLHRSVILLLEHNTQGTYGIVLNRPTYHKLGDTVKNLPREILDKFGQQEVAFGGMVRRLQYLHDLNEVGGMEIPLCKSTFYAGGDVDKAVTLVNDRPELINNFHFYVGCCTWQPGQLEQEITQGYWIPMRSYADQVVIRAKQCADRDRGIRAQDIEGGGDTRMTIGTNTATTTPGGRDNRESSTIKNDGDSGGKGLQLWSYLLFSMGAPFHECCDLPYYADASTVESLDWK